ncbi:ubiquitin carboxyl-terminal hydrolase 48-like [Neocloeon triangulifer]|uniref:ubiquitin carboxyl-terminal hydrolase 48-like n=1 Tax=Neocloeon triangulifer TaxID=2078957 RepID=UPI00286EC181|nr:ubiquitin carboxyl-terminal hydrolase 48-like [Neocloeon triangulifer]
MAKNKWTWFKEIKSPQDLQPKQLEDAYCIKNQACSKGKHRPCKNNPRCVVTIIDKFWSAEEPPASNSEGMLKYDLPYAFAGLKNYGALCYCNVFLQLWYHNRLFRDAIYKWHPVTDGDMDPEVFQATETYLPEANSIIGQLQLIIAEMEFGNAKVVDPLKLVEALSLNQNAHQDPQEFATLFLNIEQYMVENICKKIFMTECNSVIECNECGTARTTPNSMLNFQLPLTSKKQTVQEIIKSTMDGEKMDEENQYFCGVCLKKCDAVKKLEFTKLPPTFVIQVLRSEYNREKNRITKLKTFLEINQEIDLSPFSSETADSTNAKKYKLSAVVVHLGEEVSGGHYIINVKDADKGKWYSFNDSSIEPMHKLCLVEGGKTGKISKVHPDSLLSNCAYMIVYDSVDQPEVVPTLPPWLEMHISTQNAILQTEEGDKQTDENMKNELWQFNKEYFSEILEHIVPKNETGEFLPLSWVTAWAENPQMDDVIENESFLCPHKKLAYNKVSETRLVSNDVADTLFEKYKGGPRLALPQSLCSECIAIRCNLLQLQEAVDKDSKLVTQEMKALKGSESEDSYWVSKATFGRWRTLAKQRIENQLAESGEQNSEQEDEPMEDKASESPEGGKECITNGVSDSEPSEPKRPRLSSETSAEEKEPAAEEEHKKNGHTSPFDMKEFILNSDLVCEHGALSTNESLRRLVPKVVWNTLKLYFPNSLEFPLQTETCETCQDHDLKDSVKLEERVEFAKKLKDSLPALIAFPNTKTSSNKHVRFETPSMRPKTLYVVNFDFVQKLSRFVKNPTKVAPPTEIQNSGLMCKHQLVHVDLGMNGSFDVMPDDKSFWVLIEPSDWEVLIKNFCSDYLIVLQSTHSATEPDQVFPEMCIECLVNRKKNINFNYENSYVHIRRVESDLSPKKMSASKSAPSDPGRSRRRRHKVDFDIKVSAADSIRTVKKEIMKKLDNGSCFSDLHLFSQDGRALDELDRTLREYEISQDTTILLKEDKINEENSDGESCCALTADPEQGFVGTILAQQ